MTNTTAPTLLIVDDDLALRTAFARALGYQVVTATGSPDLVDLIVDHQPGAILMDNQMPGASGIDLIRLIRGTWSIDALPIVLISGSSMHLIDHDRTLVLADPVRLRQVLLNLVSNAIKYGGNNAPIRIAVRPLGAHTAIDVIDQGPGVQADQLDRLFVPFDRLDADAPGEQGSGVGLSVAKQLVELMHGTIDVTSEHGAGTTFTVTLPASAAAEETRHDDETLQISGASYTH